MKWDLKSRITFIVTITMCVAFLITLGFVLAGAIDPTAAIVMIVVQAFIGSQAQINAFYFSKKKDDSKDDPDKGGDT